MGFLQGVRQIGEYYEASDKSDAPGDLKDVLNYLKLPLGSVQSLPEERKPLEIRVTLRVEDVLATPLHVNGVGEISLSDYLGGGKESDMLWKYLYCDPPGSNVGWRYSTVYKLGMGAANNALSELLNPQKNGLNWKEDKEARYFKLNKVMKGFEETGSFLAGSADLIMQHLEQRVDEVAALWQDKKRSYLLVFGIADDSGRFLFPGETPALRAHFLKKKGMLGQPAEKPPDNTKKGALRTSRHAGGINSDSICCALCHAHTDSPAIMSEIFKFSTFDKVNFLPGVSRKNEQSVFPICERCSSLLARGKTEIEGKSSFGIGIKDLQVWVVPEVIGKRYFKQLIKDGQDYLTSGVSNEENHFELITRREASFVYHFLFVEKNNAQVILHRLVEDIPPSHFRKIKNIWQKTYADFAVEGERNLDQIIRELVWLLMSLAGKTEGEKAVMKESVLILLAALFQDERIEVSTFKKAVVTRLPALLHDEDWLFPPKGKYGGGNHLNRLWMFFEFLARVNQNLHKEGENL